MPGLSRKPCAFENVATSKPTVRAKMLIDRRTSESSSKI